MPQKNAILLGGPMHSKCVPIRGPQYLCQTRIGPQDSCLDFSTEVPASFLVKTNVYLWERRHGTIFGVFQIPRNH